MFNFRDMNNPGEDYPCFVVDEEILFNFEDFCDKMYNDPLVQKFGFFKVSGTYIT